MWGSDSNNGSVFDNLGSDSGGSIFDNDNDSKESLEDKYSSATPGSSSIFDSKNDTRESMFENDSYNTGGIFDNKENETQKSMFDTDSSQQGSLFDSNDNETQKSMFENESYGKGSLFDSNDNEAPKSMFENESYGKSGLLDGISDSHSSSSMFGEGLKVESGLFENNNAYEHESDRYEMKDMNIHDDDKYKAEYLTQESNVAGINVRGSNYGNMSVTDGMRGIQANRLNIDGDNVSLAEQHSDASLDKRAMNGLYNTTLSDMYNDKTKYMAHHGLDTDGMIDVNKDYQIDTFSGTDAVDKNDVFAGTSHKMDLDETMSLNYGEQSEIESIYKKDALHVDNDIYSGGLNSNMNTTIPNKNSYDKGGFGSLGGGVENTESGLYGNDNLYGSNNPYESNNGNLEGNQEMTPGELAKIQKQEKDELEKFQRSEKKRIEKEDKAQEKLYKREASSSQYVKDLENQNIKDTEEANEKSIYDTSDKNEKDDKDISVLDVIAEASAVGKTGEVSKSVYDRMSDDDKVKIINEGRAPDEISLAEKELILKEDNSKMEHSKEEFNKLSNDEKMKLINEGSTVYDIDPIEKEILLREEKIKEERKEEERVIIKREEEIKDKKEEYENFQRLSDDEKLEKIQRDGMIEDLDLYEQEKLKQELAIIEEKKQEQKEKNEKTASEEAKESLKEESPFDKLGKKEEEANPFDKLGKEDLSNGESDVNPSDVFKVLPLEARLKMVKDGKVPKGVEPALVQKTLKEEKDRVEKEVKLEKKVASKIEKERLKQEKRDKSSSEFIKELEDRNIKGNDYESGNKVNKKKNSRNDDDLILQDDGYEAETLEHFHQERKNDNPLQMEEDEKDENSELLLNIDKQARNVVHLPDLEDSEDSKNTPEQFITSAPKSHTSKIKGNTEDNAEKSEELQKLDKKEERIIEEKIRIKAEENLAKPVIQEKYKEGKIDKKLFAGIISEDKKNIIYKKEDKDISALDVLSVTSSINTTEKISKDMYERLSTEEKLKVINDGRVPDEISITEKENIIREETLKNKKITEEVKDIKDKDISALDVLAVASSINTTEKISKDMYERLSTEEKLKVINDGRVPDEISITEKENIIRKELNKEKYSKESFNKLSREEKLKIINEKNPVYIIDPVEKELLIKEEKIKEERKTEETINNKKEKELKEKKEEYNTFQKLSDDEKLEKIQKDGMIEGLDLYEQEKIKEELAIIKDKKEKLKNKTEDSIKEEAKKEIKEEKLVNSLKDKEMTEDKVNPSEIFKVLPLVARLKMVKDGKVPKGVEPVLVQKTLKEEKDRVEKEIRLGKKLEEKEEKERVKQERKDKKNNEFISELEERNIKSNDYEKGDKVESNNPNGDKIKEHLHKERNNNPLNLEEDEKENEEFLKNIDILSRNVVNLPDLENSGDDKNTSEHFITKAPKSQTIKEKEKEENLKIKEILSGVVLASKIKLSDKEDLDSKKEKTKENKNIKDVKKFKEMADKIKKDYGDKDLEEFLRNIKENNTRSYTDKEIEDFLRNISNDKRNELLLDDENIINNEDTSKRGVAHTKKAEKGETKYERIIRLKKEKAALKKKLKKEKRDKEFMEKILSDEAMRGSDNDKESEDIEENELLQNLKEQTAKEVVLEDKNLVTNDHRSKRGFAHLLKDIVS